MIAELAIAAAIATAYAGKPTTVTCVDYGRNDPTLGEALAGSSEATLANRVCRALRRPAHTPAFAQAVLVTIHEALHMRGDTNEDRVECKATRLVPDALARFFHQRNLPSWKAHIRAVSLRPDCVA
jgi:hypothetical protein